MLIELFLMSFFSFYESFVMRERIYKSNEHAFIIFRCCRLNSETMKTMRVYVHVLT